MPDPRSCEGHRSVASGYTPSMKTAISIPDDLFAEADRLAKRLHQSRSQLYSQAVREYVGRHSEESVTAAIDAAIDAGVETDIEFVRRTSWQTLRDSKW